MIHALFVLARNARQLQGIVVILFISLALTEPAYAYLDPGTGSIILQIFLGGIAGLAVAGNLFWSRITGFFSNLFTRDGGRENDKATLSSDEPSVDAGQASEQSDKKQ